MDLEFGKQLARDLTKDFGLPDHAPQLERSAAVASIGLEEDPEEVLASIIELCEVLALILATKKEKERKRVPLVSVPAWPAGGAGGAAGK